MTTFITGDATAPYSASVPIPSTGEAVTAASVSASFQSLADRTEFVSASIISLSASVDTEFDVLHKSIIFQAINIDIDTDLPVTAVSGGWTFFGSAASGSTVVFMAHSSSSPTERNFAAVSNDFGHAWAFDDSGDIPTGAAQLFDCVYDPHIDRFMTVGGTGGKVFVTSDNVATTWVLVKTVSATGSLVGLHNAGNASFAVGGNGILLRNSNLTGSTTTWITEPPAGGFASTFRSVAFDETFWYACGNSGEIQRSGSSGWAAQTSGFATTLHSLAHNNGTLVSCGNSGVIVRTTNSGSTWTSVTGSSSFPSGLDFKNVDYIAKYNIWMITGTKGSVLLSSDDGLTWIYGGYNEGAENEIFSSVTSSNGALHTFGSKNTLDVYHYRRAMLY